MVLCQYCKQWGKKLELPLNMFQEFKDIKSVKLYLLIQDYNRCILSLMNGKELKQNYQLESSLVFLHTVLYILIYCVIQQST